MLEPGSSAIHDDRRLTYPWGANGGRPGARGRKWIDRVDGSTEMVPSKVIDVPVEAGDLMHHVTWGGGGWGDPLRRDPDLAAKDVRRGLVTCEGAASDTCPPLETIPEQALEATGLPAPTPPRRP